ncbi:ABC transporter ATP-binding protein [Parageobacillus thermoglucosidasius]|uniref:Antibiotic ABC transporter ATP-binding protein n=1 Tax=Parageobacillus thermoglucosidasius TaxID=1426 RepID=A0AAN0YSU3_PARTM|nr:ABC transporter ATP-binding protein [Parageobacillus thermoglucosidasius]ALF10357.1 antibiotic ABC transporter ATP-binding protein [Parageobacillus thermoglucosidasius]ANZ30438.1 antibiotic ABC transporter ATP-binding protein [Parageobacillus thermoglucosidasius]APM81176.1 antibiotic ABC transporter ATP-binding protein [Parageobacillus thermoglucosidasius]KJX68582.1 antibiotic ABC transporter ATP-binding protein [Parageobacillus thermoglucosidasius]RDE21765.1 ABC transporter ATP-binding pro
MILEAVELTKQFKQMKAVNGVNLFLEKGEIVGLLGPNGAGKSTTISMISTLIPPTSGDVRFNNESVLKNPTKLRKVLGVVPQEIALYTDLSAKENLYFFGRMYRLSGSGLRKKVDEILELIGLTERQNDLVKHFSGGMKRRLNIGVALLHEPEFIIMDEPTVGIDPQSRNYILETVKRLNQEKQMTVLYTSHYMEEVEFLCDRIYIMDKGSIIASGTKEEIKNILSSENTVQIKVERVHEPFIDALHAEPIINRVTVQDRLITILTPKEVNVFNMLFKLAEKTNTVLTSVEIQTPTLEDVFLHLTGRALRD